MGGFVAEMDTAPAPQGAKDPYEVFLRGFYGSPERQRVEEYFREQRDAASRNKVRAIEDNNQSAHAFFDGCQHTADGALAWFRSYDPGSAE